MELSTITISMAYKSIRKCMGRLVYCHSWVWLLIIFSFNTLLAHPKLGIGTKENTKKSEWAWTIMNQPMMKMKIITTYWPSQNHNTWNLKFLYLLHRIVKAISWFAGTLSLLFEILKNRFIFSHQVLSTLGKIHIHAQYTQEVLMSHDVTVCVYLFSIIYANRWALRAVGCEDWSATCQLLDCPVVPGGTSSRLSPLSQWLRNAISTRILFVKMFSRVVAFLMLFLASASAFVPSTARTMLNAGALSMKMDAAKTLIPMIPAALSAPAFASDVSYVPLSRDSHLYTICLINNPASFIFASYLRHYWLFHTITVVQH